MGSYPESLRAASHSSPGDLPGGDPQAPGSGAETGQSASVGPVSLRAIKRRLAQLERRSREGRTAEVITAVPLTPSQRAAFETRLRERHGPDLALTFRVDRAILGGVIVRIGDRMLDDSLATRLAGLRQALLGSRVRQQ